MIDNFSLGLTHALLLYAAWRLLARPDLDRDNAVSDTDGSDQTRWGRRR